jgi:peptidoglycan DL-endopeptidase CwlO
MRVHKTPWLRRLGVLVVIASLVPSFDAPAHADDIADKQAEAARIAEQVEAEGQKVSMLAERLNQARLHADGVQAEVAKTEAEVARTDAQVADAKETLKGYVVRSYMRGGRMSQLQLLLGGQGEANDLAVRNGYVKSLTADERQAIDALADAREAAESKREALEATQKDARAALGAVESERRAAADAEAQAKATLGKVQGELASMVAAVEARRAEEAARRAQAELAERRQREEAARQRSTTTTTRRSTTSPAPPPPDDGPAPAPAPNAGAARAVEEAKRQLGKPYEYGGSGPDTFDCSGLTAWAWRAGGKSLPHSSRAQYDATRRVSVDDVQPGDLLFYGSPIHHVGIYVGNGQMIEAPETGKNVRYASIYRRDLVGVGRVT